MLLYRKEQIKQTNKQNEPVMRVSNDNGKTFGDKIMLSSNAATTTTTTTPAAKPLK